MVEPFPALNQAHKTMKLAMTDNSMLGTIIEVQVAS